MSDIHEDRFSGDDDLEERKGHSPTTSEYMRKRRLRSNSSPEASWIGHALGTLAGDGPTSSSTSLRPSHSPLGPDDLTGGRNANTGEDSLTLRRREANRLAAQRFRSRKKGYQDSLEEKVRQLEEDKELLVRRLTEATGVPRSHRRHRDEEAGRAGASYHTLPSPERKDPPVDTDVRIAALESANRRLQDELRNVSEENDKLRGELDSWRRWEREQREAAWAIEASRRDERRARPPTLPPLDIKATVHHGPRSLPSYPSPGGFISQLAPPSAHSSSTPLLSPVEGSHGPSTPAIRLPPIRLPPISGDHAGPPSAFLPRPAELDAMGMAIISSQNGRPNPLSDEERRRPN